MYHLLILSGYICWSSRMADLMLYYLSAVPCTCNGVISASTICHLCRYILVVWYIGRSK